MQKVNFQIEVLIHDDASTDKTVCIINEYETKYPNIVKPIYQKENHFSKGVAVTRVYQFPRARGKYIALCEGDDYWIDPYKLQKQVDFLESNNDCIGVCTNFMIINEKGKTIKKRIKYEYFEQNGRNIISGLPKSLTVMYRNSFEAFKVLKRIEFVDNSDEAIAVIMKNWGKIAIIDEITGVYRKHNNGFFSTQNQFNKNRMILESLKKIKSFCEKNNLIHDLDNKILDYNYRILAYYIYNLDFKKAIEYYKNAETKIGPIHYKSIKKVLIYSLMYLKKKL
jgi:glycosyltransferase involved in cell wall biosynthesis